MTRVKRSRWKRSAVSKFVRFTEVPWWRPLPSFRLFRRVGPKGIPISWVALQALADGLNAPPGHRRGLEGEAWETGRQIMELVDQAGAIGRLDVPMPSTAVRRFNTLAVKTPSRVYLDDPDDDPDEREHPGPVWGHVDREGRWIVSGGRVYADRRGAVVDLLDSFFKNVARERFKRCPQCRAWFLDTTKNRTQGRCSQQCTNRWWNRAKRRAKGHGKGRPKNRSTRPRERQRAGS